MTSRLRVSMAAGAACAIALAVACSSSSGGSDSSGGGGASPNACSDTFDVLYGSSCAGTIAPADELSRIKGRYVQACQAALALPGVGVTAAQLEACAQAVKGAGCRTSQTPQACQFPAGTVPAGSACVASAQCQSSQCDFTPAGGADAGSGVPACGTCATLVADGQPCGQMASATCGPASTCDFGAMPAVCKARVYGAAGAACDRAANLCQNGTTCDAQSKTCTALGGMGSPCMSYGDCAEPLVCPSGTCTPPGGARASCSFDLDCAAGLGCDTTNGTCGTITWVSAGGACGNLSRCRVGTCPLAPMPPGGGGDDGGGSRTCPEVVPDGQPCSPDDPTKTCDTFATCTGGSCTLAPPSSCP